MTILILQSLLLLLVAFIVGCLLGCVFRRFLSREAAAERGVSAPPLSSGRPAQPAAASAPKPAAAPEARPAAEPAISTPEPYVFTADRLDGAIVLSGRLQTAADRDRVLKAARDQVPALVIDDRLSVGGGVPKRVDWPAAVAFALNQLVSLSSGRVRLQDDVVSLSGTAVDAEAGDRIHKAMHGDLPAGLTLGTFDLKGLGSGPGDAEAEEPKSAVEAKAQTTADVSAAQAPDSDVSVRAEAEPSDRARESISDAGSKQSEAEPAEAVTDATEAQRPESKPLDVDAPEGLAGQQPAGYAAARGGQADDLKRIKGIGKVNERKLNALGVWHFDQIAAWTDAEIEWVDGYLAFRGRIVREDWVGQARALTET